MYRMEQRVPMNHLPDAPQWVLYARRILLREVVQYARAQQRIYQNAGIDGEFRVVDENKDRVIRHFTSSRNPARVPELGVPTQTRSTR